MISKTQVHLALERIVENSKSKALNYCMNYAKVGLGMSGYELYVQVLYVLNNMTHWRGPEATEVRKTLKQFVKEYKEGE